MCVPYRNSAINASRSAFTRNLAFRMTEVRQHFIFHDGHYTAHGHTHSVVNITLLVTMDIIYTGHGRALHKAQSTHVKELCFGLAQAASY